MDGSTGSSPTVREGCEASAFVPPLASRRISELLSMERVQEESSDSSCASVSSSDSSCRPTTPRNRRARGRRIEDSTVCSSGFSDINVPGTGPALESVLAARRKNQQEEYLLKLKGRSHAKARWWTRDEAINTFDETRLMMRVRRYLAEKQVEPFVDYEPGPNPFPVQYTVVDRVIAVSVETQKALTLWKGLPYAAVTWEPLSEVGAEHVERHRLFLKRRMGVPAQEPVLRPYQEEGVAWMHSHYARQGGCILADDMGLGKTLQSVMLLRRLAEEGVAGPYLVVAPVSVLGHWTEELRRFSGLNTVCYHGSIESRKTAIEYELLDKQGRLLPHVVVTGYETLKSEREAKLIGRKWRAVVLDEAHRLKNASGQAWALVKRLQSSFKLLLTGTPVQNNTEELWALLHLANPQKFTAVSKQSFMGILNSPSLTLAVKELKSAIEPCILRRTKDVVLKGEIPNRTDTHIKLALTGYQRAIYSNLLLKNREALTGLTKGRLGNMVTQLRSVCSHPFLIDGTREMAAEKLDGTTRGLPPVIACSSKMVVLDKLLRKWHAEGHKTLVFSQWRITLDIIEEMLAHRGLGWGRLDGAVASAERQQQISRFNQPGMDDMPVFLLTTRAGGVGLNLTAATRVVIFDTDWNPQQDLQAAARCHRIGQEKEVKVFRLVSTDTIEERMLEVASQKLALATALLSSAEDNGGGADKATEADLRTFLRHGAYKMLKAGNEAADDLLFSSSADDILDRAHEGMAGTSMEEIKNFSEVSVSHCETDAEYWNKLLHTPPPSPPPASAPVRGLQLSFGRKRPRSQQSDGPPGLSVLPEEKKLRSTPVHGGSGASASRSPAGLLDPASSDAPLVLTFGSKRKKLQAEASAAAAASAAASEPPPSAPPAEATPTLQLVFGRKRTSTQSVSSSPPPSEKRPRLSLQRASQ
eukprot:Rhum_TRINITY_DN21050_c0_g1::Rhum_TRINITY_DN21050_c0_g1_i1::g.172976::m.172976/K14437/CHD7; chromodomain-helicase-DNA-binding protein 7